MSIFEKGSWSIGTYFGIPVKIHWTFGYIFLYVLWVANREQLHTRDALWFLLFILSLFFCVVLHEYGHALTAKRYGVKTADIILTPLGGIARLQKMPDKPMQEFWVAIAGPAVNVVIAVILAIGLYFWGNNTVLDVDESIFSFDGQPVKFFLALFWTNITLIIFNLLPVFPMDGGRVLRALLSLKWKKVTATKIAARTGQAFALVFFIYGIYSSNITLAFIGVFIFQGAYAEYRMTKSESLLRENKLQDIMIPCDNVLRYDDLISNVRELLYYTSQHLFVVSDGLHIIGSVDRNQITDYPHIFEPIRLLGLKPVGYAHAETTFFDVYSNFAEDKYDIVIIDKGHENLYMVDKFTFYEALAQIGLIKKKNTTPA